MVLYTLQFGQVDFSPFDRHFSLFHSQPDLTSGAVECLAFLDFLLKQPMLREILDFLLVRIRVIV